VSTNLEGLAIEGPAIPPLSFGPYGGQILVADENDGQVHAIASDGTVTLDVFDWHGTEGVIVIPSALCTFCSSGCGNSHGYPNSYSNSHRLANEMKNS